MLGQLEGFFSVGELRFIWEESFAENQPCGCGASFMDCSFWNSVVEEAYGSFDRVNLDKVMQLKRSVDRMRYIPQLASSWKSPGYLRNLRSYLVELGQLYEAIRSVSDSRVIVDSSKDPSYAYVLSNLPNVDLHMVHLVRDSRAVAYSWLRTKVKYETQGKKVYMPQHSPASSSFGWMRANALIETLRLLSNKNKVVRYENLIENPQDVLSKILSLVQEEKQDLSFVEGRKVELGVNHTVAGNPIRFKRGMIDLRLDEEWKSGMRDTDRYTVTALTWPFLLRYGYLNSRGLAF